MAELTRSVVNPLEPADVCEARLAARLPGASARLARNRPHHLVAESAHICLLGPLLRRESLHRAINRMLFELTKGSPWTACEPREIPDTWQRLHCFDHLNEPT